MKRFGQSILIVFFCLPVLFSFGQKESGNKKLNDLSDSTIKSEIASFTRSKAYSKDSSFHLKSPLIEIPLQKCTDSQVYLSLSKINSSVSTFIHLYFRGKNPDRSLDSIFVVTHSHFWVEIPRSAFEGINQNLSCEATGSGGKRSHLTSPNYKAYYSSNRRRMYIYMIGGSEGDRYEVTWVFVDDRYLLRVIDKIQ